MIMDLLINKQVKNVYGVFNGIINIELFTMRDTTHAM